MQRRLPLVDKIVAAPCDVPWDTMTGNDRQRHCSSCKRDVFNLSAMSADEAAAFLEAAAALPENVHKPCVSLFCRTDGTVLTNDCPVGLSRRRRRAILTSTLPIGAVAVVALTALGGVLGMMNHRAALAEDEPPPVPTIFEPVPVVGDYVNLFRKPTPSFENDRPSGVHWAGGLMPQRPDVQVKKDPPPVQPPPVQPNHEVKRLTGKPAVSRPPRAPGKVAQKPTREPTNAEILKMLEQEQNTL